MIPFDQNHHAEFHGLSRKSTHSREYLENPSVIVWFEQEIFQNKFLAFYDELRN